MSTNLISATDAILASLKTQWDADTPAITTTIPVVVNEILEPDLKEHPRQTGLPWARIAIRHATGRKVTLNNDAGTARYRREGIVWIQVFVPRNDGSSYTTIQQLAMVAVKAYEGKRAGPAGDVVYTDVSMQEKPIDGSFLHYDVKVAFYWDEIR